jgi:hypothetical protein
MHHDAIDNDSRGCHHAVPHDLADVLDLVEFDRHTQFGSGLLDESIGVAAIGAASAEYTDLHELSLVEVQSTALKT